MKCVTCRGPAVIDVRRHNSNFCAEHFIELCRRQVQKAIDRFEMFTTGDRLLVAVSGGKDSLAVWDILVDLGYDADGLYIGLGIGDYSDISGQHARSFAESRGLRLLEVDITTTYGFDIPNGSRAAKRVPCSACGLTKRHLFDAVAIDEGYDVLVTGHNLDDEAAVLFGNSLNWNVEYLARQYPVLEARDGFPRKVKPLVRLSEREMAAYCVLSSIDYLVDECPMAAGNRHLGYKEALNRIESMSPGTKHSFYFGYLDRASELFRSGHRAIDPEGVVPCASCGAPSSGGVCAFCRLIERAGGSRSDGSGVEVRVELGTKEDMRAARGER